MEILTVFLPLSVSEPPEEQQEEQQEEQEAPG